MANHTTRPTPREQIFLEHRRQQVAARYLRGEYQSQIAADLHLSQQQISIDLKVIRAQWLASTLRDFDALKAEQLAKIDQIEIEAWSAWERSKQPREITVTEATEGRQAGRKATVRREGQAGDPRFLERIQKCIDQRCQILGIGAMQEALKNAGLGLAALLDEARVHTAFPAPLPLPPMAQA